jgi:hypothetical protein
MGLGPAAATAGTRLDAVSRHAMSAIPKKAGISREFFTMSRAYTENEYFGNI